MDPNLKSQAYFNKAQNNCVETALNFLKGFSEEEIHGFIDDVFRKAGDEGISLESALEQSKGEFAKNLQNKMYRQTYQYTKLFDPKTGWYNRILKKELTANDILSKDTMVNRGQNVETTQEGISTDLRQKIVGRLSKPAQQLAFSAKWDRAIAEYLTNGKIPKDAPLEVKEVGDAILRLTKTEAPFELVTSTAMGLDDLNKNRFMRASYDPGKVRGTPTILKALTQFRNGRRIEMRPNEEARADFVKKMVSRSDLEGMFPAVANKEEAAQEAFSTMYDRIIQGGTINEGNILNIKDEPQIAKQREMFVQWKSWDHYLDHLQEFGNGSGSLWESMLSEMQSVGKRAGMARVLGADPTWAFKQLREAELTAKGNVPFIKDPTNVFMQLQGGVNIPYRPYIAQMAANFRVYTGMVRQVMLAPFSLNDTNFGLPSLNQITSTPYWQDFASKMKAIYSVYKSQISRSDFAPEIKKMSDNMHHSILYEHGAHARFIDANDMGAITRKISSWFYRVVGMSGKDEGNRAGAMLLASKAITDRKELPLSELPEGMQKRLQSFNFSPGEWDALREHAGDTVGLETVRDMPAETINRLAKVLNTSATEARQNLATKLYGWMNSAADETILTPGAMERAMMYRGTQAGTVYGEAARSFWQFKGFMMSYINRILINGFTEDSSKMKFRWAMSNFLYTLPVTLAGNWFYNLSKGEEPKWDPKDWDLDDWMNNLVPAIGMFSSTLNPKQQNANMALQLLQSPSIKVLGDLMAGAGSAINIARPSTGDFDERTGRFGRKLGTLAYDATPLNSIPYLSSWWKQHAM